MTRKPEIAENIGKQNNDLPGKTRQAALKDEKLLAQGINEEELLDMELQEALTEKDVFRLRQKLQKLLGPNADKNPGDTNFNLFDGFGLPGLFDQDFDPAMFSEYVEPLPGIHVQNHKRASCETVHQFYREQVAIEDDEDTESDFENELFQDMEEALLEKDIMQLREGLKLVASTALQHHFTTEDINEYLSGEMDDAEKEFFEAEMAHNHLLNEDVRLNLEIEEALTEPDIIKLRDTLTQIIHQETSHSFNLEEVEAFINGELSQQTKVAFLEEMEANSDLRAEIRLLRELNEAFTESDVSALRESLRKIPKDALMQNKESLVNFNGLRRVLNHSRKVAAVAFAIIGLATVITFSVSKQTGIYEQFYSPPQAITQFRSATTDANDLLSMGFSQYNRAEYPKALESFARVLVADPVNPAAMFYMGAAQQALSEHQKAIKHFSMVISHRDNLFIEQAEWYKALSYIELGMKNEALRQLDAIIYRKGYYHKEAAIVHKKIRIKG